MLVSIKYTPNPNSIQFFVDIVWIDIVWECRNEFDSHKSPLTNSIWMIGGISYILVGPNFLIVNKQTDYNWNELISKIQVILSKFIMTETHIFPLSKEKYDKILTSYTLKEQNIKKREELSDLGKKIWDVVDAKIRPGLALHGGGIEIISLENNVLNLILTGACVGCPSASDTIEQGIKQILLYFFPELINIECIS